MSQWMSSSYSQISNHFKQKSIIYKTSCVACHPVLPKNRHVHSHSAKIKSNKIHLWKCIQQFPFHRVGTCLINTQEPHTDSAQMIQLFSVFMICLSKSIWCHAMRWKLFLELEFNGVGYGTTYLKCQRVWVCLHSVYSGCICMCTFIFAISEMYFFFWFFVHTNWILMTTITYDVGITNTYTRAHTRCTQVINERTHTSTQTMCRLLLFWFKQVVE